MQHMTGKMKREVLLELPDMGEALLAPRLLELLERVVRALDVRRMVLVVVEVENLTRQVRLEGARRTLGKHFSRAANAAHGRKDETRGSSRAARYGRSSARSALARASRACRSRP